MGFFSILYKAYGANVPNVELLAGVMCECILLVSEDQLD